MRAFLLILLSYLILSMSLLGNPSYKSNVDRGIRKLENFSFLGCDFQIPEDAYLNYGEGQKKNLRVYPKFEDRFFLVFRELSRVLEVEEIQEILPKEPKPIQIEKIFLQKKDYHTDRNDLVQISLLLNESKIFITLFVRKEEESLIASFLNLQWISTCR
ncbi:MAG: hypothetical protein CK427_02010 [Leptospira sp.]|nr:MAG: hypothetical protein CK427_02010 [Leptospira sp.]